MPQDSPVRVSILLFQSEVSVRPCCGISSLRFALVCVNVFTLNLMLIVVVPDELLRSESRLSLESCEIMLPRAINRVMAYHVPLSLPFIQSWMITEEVESYLYCRAMVFDQMI